MFIFLTRFYYYRSALIYFLFGILYLNQYIFYGHDIVWFNRIFDYVASALDTPSSLVSKCMGGMKRSIVLYNPIK